LLPVADKAFVGPFGLNGELALAIADLLQSVGLGDHAALTLTARRAGEQFKAPQLLWAMNVAATTRSTPGIVISRRISSEPSA
jgi:hypothetical protein